MGKFARFVQALPLGAVMMAAVCSTSAAEPSFGTFTDTRDGQTYKTVKIGGKRWMAENLNYQADSSWCYGNADSNCVKYGRLYDWDAAITACPAGYHLPSRSEWDGLGNAVGGKRRDYKGLSTDWFGAGKVLKAKRSWNDHNGKSSNGTDNFGFSALPGGYRDNNGDFSGAGGYGHWWTARIFDHDDKGSVWLIDCTGSRGLSGCGVMTLYYGDANAQEWAGSFSIRCVADRP